LAVARKFSEYACDLLFATLKSDDTGDTGIEPISNFEALALPQERYF